MNYELMLQSEAIVDIQKAFEWYEHRTAGLGFEFIEEIEEGFERVSKHPHHYSAINRKYRKLRINRFPYLIVFEIEENKVVVNSVRHISQEPKR